MFWRRAWRRSRRGATRRMRNALSGCWTALRKGTYWDPGHGSPRLKIGEGEHGLEAARAHILRQRRGELTEQAGRPAFSASTWKAIRPPSTEGATACLLLPVHALHWPMSRLRLRAALPLPPIFGVERALGSTSHSSRTRLFPAVRSPRG